MHVSPAKDVLCDLFSLIGHLFLDRASMSRIARDGKRVKLLQEHTVCCRSPTVRIRAHRVDRSGALLMFAVSRTPDGRPVPCVSYGYAVQ
jgi:hypothetical protein